MTDRGLQFHCVECGKLLGIVPEAAGHMVLCPACGQETSVPEAAGPLVVHSHAASGPAAQTDAWRSAAVAELASTGDEEGFTLRAQKSELEELDLTPMVDVTFLLLIFFMITASFSTQKSLEVPPPDPQTQGAAPTPLEQLEENSVMVRVEAGDRFFVDEQPVEMEADLPVALAAAMADGNRTEMVIEAEDAARHEAVVQVYDAGNEVGMQRIRLAAPSGR